MPVPSCFSWLRQLICLALALALAKAGSNMAARMAMMAMTTSNSIKVNAFRLDGLFIRLPFELNQVREYPQNNPNITAGNRKSGQILTAWPPGWMPGRILMSELYEEWTARQSLKTQ